jgi:hypothetical protein
LAKKHFILPLLLLLCIAILIIYGSIPQEESYHLFADVRTLWDIPNFWNVMTNLPFLLVGILGIRAVRKAKEKVLRYTGLIMFWGFVLLTFGSGYYHLWPRNDTLVYDRLCMTLIFMSFFSFIIQERTAKQRGYRTLLILNLIGVLSVIYWWVSEGWGKGDLRPYILVQFFPLLAIPLLLLLYKSTFNMTKEVSLIFLFFGLAKLTETYDKEIYNWLEHTLSGHSLKHLLMAVAGYWMVVLIQRRIK